MTENQTEVAQTPPDAENADLLDWWVGTVVLTFFPTLISMIMSLFRYGSVDFGRLIGDGELILSSFLIITPSIMNLFKNRSMRNNRYARIFFYILLFVSFIQLVMYTCIKTNPTNRTGVVYTTSVICVVSSVILAWQSEKMLLGRRIP